MPAVRGQGQWALGYREPLNPNEQVKKDSNPLTVKQRVLDIYSKQGFDSIDGADLRGRLRWYGLYTQRADGIPGGKTAILEPQELEAPFFMLRIRIDGGQLTSEQLRVIGQIATEFGRDVADVTDRQNVQLHWIRIEDVPEIWERLDAGGLYTTEACGDSPRVILGCPLAGVDADEVINGDPVIREVAAKYLGDPAYSNLPRKFKTSISGCTQHCTNHEINDVALVGVVHPELGPGYDLWVGGGLSTNPKLGVRLGAFVEPARVAEAWEGVISVFRDYGYRRSRNHARLKFLMADWGPERFREVLESEYLTAPLPDGPAPEPTVGNRDHVGVHDQGNGLKYVGVVPRAGRTSGSQLTRVAELSERLGGGRVSTTAQQGLVLLDVPAESVDEVVAALEAEDLRVRPSVFRRGTMACTGLEFCKLAIVETKARAVDLYTELEKRLPDFPEPISINVNGCPNSCARFQTADIGLKGSIVSDVEGFQVHLGGSMGKDAGFGRKARGLKVTADGAADYVERILNTYLAERVEGDSFATWVRSADEALLK
ncbi:MAG: nitrite and sulphite reductase 4Fe-4S region [Frankiales bacterium]|nr:nitrite and sulphite reductase 4Fe-4S region [Frankiales bacterium]